MCMCKRVGSVLLIAITAACADVEAEPYEQAWEDFLRAATPVEFPGMDDAWIVDYDILIEGEIGLRTYFERYVRAPERGDEEDESYRAWTQKLTAANPDYDDAWNSYRKNALTYCIHSNFPPQYKPLARAWMEEHARQWELAADINFAYLAEYDSSCVATAPHPHFSVEFTLYLDYNACAVAFFPYLDNGTLTPNTGPWAESRRLGIRQATLDLDVGCNSTGLIMRHELGHVLGFRHESAHPLSGCDPEEPALFPHYLSEFDDRAAVTKFVPGCTSSLAYSISRRDAVAVALEYDLPGVGWRGLSPGAGMQPQWFRFDSDATADIYVWTPDPALPDGFARGQANGTLITGNIAFSPPGVRYRPIAGNFAGDERSDIFFYSPGSELDRLHIRSGTDAKTGFTTQGYNITSFFRPLVGQFCGTTFADILWYGPGPEDDQLWCSTGAPAGNPPYFTQHFLSIGGPTTYYLPIVGDFNGDSITDVFFYHPDSSTEQSVYLAATGAGQTQQSFVDHDTLGLPGNKDSQYFFTELVGDFDGDGSDDIFWYSRHNVPVGVSSGRFWGGGAQGPATQNVSSPAPTGVYKPYAGDFAGDNKTDILWLNQTGTTHQMWIMQPNFTYTMENLQLGPLRDANVLVGDFNGDGKADLFTWELGVETRVWISNGNGAFVNTQTLAEVLGFPVGLHRG